MSLDFFVSTTAFRGTPVASIVTLARAEGLALEFSSALPPGPGLVDTYLEAPVRRMPHNYFPAPEDPFVLNLASLDPSVLHLSVAHALQGLELAAAVDAPGYGVHAGFCLDPDPEDLGAPLRLAERAPREEHWERFEASLDALVRRADALGVDLYVENNVVAPFNLGEDGTAPLLCATVDELERLVARYEGSRFGILLDTGHLKVSAATFGFDPGEALERLAPAIRAFHHSDNDGTEDANAPITDEYWFLPHAPRFGHEVHVLEVHDQSVGAIQAQRALLEAATGPVPSLPAPS
jgi:sugar phosphate isomerase/epimerase